MDSSTTALPEIVSIIETALTPVFLLAGTAAVLNVVSICLARVSDRANDIADLVLYGEDANEARREQLRYLRRRTLALEASVILATRLPYSPACRRWACWPVQYGKTITALFWFFGCALVAFTPSFFAFIYVGEAVPMLLPAASQSTCLLLAQKRPAPN